MMTTRGWWFLVIAVLMLALGLFAELPALIPLGTGLLIWFIGIGLGFTWRARILVHRIRIHRTLHDERGQVDALWVDRSFLVNLIVDLPSWPSFPHVALSERVPFALQLVGGVTDTAGPLGGEQTLRVDYEVRAPSVGRARFEGVRIRLVDLQGFYCHETFVPAVQEVRILPVLSGRSGQSSLTKRFNQLPPPGIHRVRRPGSGSELLDLRDYIPGDPPRTIAWKVSARRDKLITKEFESEVPLTCTLFLDRSASVRLGPPGRNALARMVEVAAAVAQANTSIRDLTGLCLIDEQGASPLPAGRTPRHLIGVLNLLADASGLAPTTGAAPLEDLLPLAYSFAEEVYPYLLRPEINRVPWLHTWFLARPAWSLRSPSFADRMRRFMWIGGLILLSLGAAAGVIDLWLLSEGVVPPFPLILAALLSLPMGALNLVLFLLWQLVTPQRRRTEGLRKRLAALFSVRAGLAPGGLAALLEDEETLSRHIQRFLADHQVPFSLPLYDAKGRYLFSAPEKIDVLAEALLRGVGKGHDNELFVLMVDILELSDRLDPLLRAIKVALARHHQVVVVIPWPPGLPPPGAVQEPLPAEQSSVAEAIRWAVALRFRKAYAEVRRLLTRLGVPVTCAAEEESVRLILERMERLRVAGRRGLR